MDYVTSNLHAGMCGKNKLRVYRELKEVFECKIYMYLYRVPDMGSKLLLTFRSGTHGLNKELERHITRNISKACVFCNCCDCDCESVEYVLWECPVYSNNRSVFINSLSKILFSDFHLMSAFEKTRYIFDQSIWECIMVTLITGPQILKASVRCLEFVQGKTLSRGFFDEYSFKQLHPETCGQWQ